MRSLLHLLAVVVVVVVAAGALVVVVAEGIDDRAAAAGCKIWIDYKKGDLKEPQPLILWENNTFVLPNADQNLIIKRNETIVFACPGNANGLKRFGSKPAVKAVCMTGKKFRVDKSTHEISDFTCKTSTKELIRKSNTPCLVNHQTYEIGFKLEKVYLKLLEICRDEKTFTTYYSKATLVKELSGFQSQSPRPYWKYGPYYPGHNLKNIYRAPNQINALERQLGSRELAQKYINTKNQQFLNRGHLTAKADFVFSAHQNVTFWLLNTAPQWATFNAGNWLAVENAVRNYAMNNNVDLDVYTGVHGITSLIDVNGNNVPLYLHANGTHTAFPVPRYFWKIVRNPETKRAAALVGLNEPYAADVTEDMYLCPDISGQKEVQWVNMDFKNILRGVTYVCTVETLRKAVPTIPEFEVSGILS